MFRWGPATGSARGVGNATRGSALGPATGSLRGDAARSSPISLGDIRPAARLNGHRLEISGTVTGWSALGSQRRRTPGISSCVAVDDVDDSRRRLSSIRLVCSAAAMSRAWRIVCRHEGGLSRTNCTDHRRRASQNLAGDTGSGHFHSTAPITSCRAASSSSRSRRFPANPFPSAQY